MSRSVDFEWAITEADEDGMIYVIERMVGHDGHVRYGPMKAQYGDSFVRARRDAIYRLSSRFGGIKIFNAPPGVQ